VPDGFMHENGDMRRSDRECEVLHDSAAEVKVAGEVHSVKA
jgi:hypothetical protein